MRTFPILAFLFFSTTVWTQEAPPDETCSSIASISANPKICDRRPVRLIGKVIQFRHQTSKPGNPYTEFTLADSSKQLDSFSFDHLPLENGTCIQVEGVYRVRREVGPSVFKNQVVVDKKAEGIAKVPCPAQSSSPGWSRPEIISVAILILIVLALVINRMLMPARYYRMGRNFEDYLIGLFPETEWEIEDRSSDTSKRIGRRVTGDVSYDFIVKHRATSRRFILQCKYRSRFFRKDGREGVEWARPYQIRNYRTFQRSKGWPYLVVIGVGGKPKKPDQLFVVPLEGLDHPFIPKVELLDAQRDSYASFALKNQGSAGVRFLFKVNV